MLYTAQRGATGIRLTQRYRLETGSKPAYSPRTLLADVPFDEFDWRTYGRYAIAPAVSIVVVAALLQGLPGSDQGQPKPASSSVKSSNSPVMNVSKDTTNKTATNQSSSTSATTNQTVSTSSQAAGTSTIWDVSTPTDPTSQVSTTTTDSWDTPVATTDPTTPTDGTTTPPTTGGSGGGTTTDPTTPPVDQNPTTDPTPGGTDPTDNGGVTVTTPILQVGVDVFPPSVNVGL